MTPSPRPPQSIEELAALYLTLNARVERLDGNVRQLLAERTRDALPHPTWRDVEAIRKDVADLQKQFAIKRRE